MACTTQLIHQSFIQQDWPAQKSQVPFHVLPVVWEYTKDGTILELSEGQAIERYLAKKFHIYGKNEWENHKVDQFFTSTDTAFNTFNSKVIPASLESRISVANDYYKDVLSKFIAVHEEHLEKNGSNGHYVGNSITLADIKTAQFIDRVFFYALKGADEVPISAEKTPNLWKFYETRLSIAPHRWLPSRDSRYQCLFQVVGVEISE